MIEGFTAEDDPFALVKMYSVGIYFFQERAKKFDELFLFRRRAPAPMGRQRATRDLLVVKNGSNDRSELLDSLFFLLRRLQPRIFQYRDHPFSRRLEQLQWLAGMSRCRLAQK